ncbi:3D domain-containing protein [Bacillaceae bacterium]
MFTQNWCRSKRGLILCFAVLLAAVALCAWIAVAAKAEVMLVTAQGKTVVETRAETVGEFLRERGFSPGPSDEVSPGAATKIEPGMKIVYYEARPVTLVIGTERRNVHTAKRTVQGILQEQGISLGALDRVRPSLHTIVKANEIIKVTRVEEKIVRERKTIPFSVIRKEDDTLAKGETRVLREGRNGEAFYEYKVTYVDGKETARELLAKKMTKEKRDRVVALGTVVAVARGTKQPAARRAPLKLPSRGGDVRASAQRVLRDVTLTAYSAESAGKNPNDPGYGITATGVKAEEGRTIAVDPNVIPLGWWVYIDGYGYRRAEDTGGAVNGKKIDVYFENNRNARRFGVKQADVYVIGPHKP